MKQLVKLVSVRKINSDVARSHFSPDDIETIANLFIESETTINPIILRQTSPNSYEIIDGHFEYYAAVRAREISLLKGETIQAIVLETNNEKSILEQVNRLRKTSSPSTRASILREETSSSAPNIDLESKVTALVINLEKTFKAQFEELRKDNRILSSKLEELRKESSVASPQPQNLSTPLSEEVIEKIVTKIVSTIRKIPKKQKLKVEDFKERKVDLNLASKSELMTVPRIGSVTASHIIKRRDTQGPFTSVEQLNDIDEIKTKAMSEWRLCFTIGASGNL